MTTRFSRTVGGFCLLVVFAQGIDLSTACAADTKPAPSAQAKAAVETLDKLDAYVDVDKWEVDLLVTKKLDAALKLLPQLDHIYEIELPDNVTDAQLGAVGKFKELKKLTVSGSDKLTDAGLAQLKSLTGLRELIIIAMPNITPAGWDSLGVLTQLQTLSLPLNNLHGSPIKTISRLNGLTSLDVSHCELEDGDLASLEALTGLAELKLESNAFSDAGLVHVAKLGHLTSLGLLADDVTDAGLRSLAGLTGLTRLDLEETAVSDEGMSALAGMKQLQYLGLSHTRVHGPGFKYLAGKTELVGVSLDGLSKLTGVGLDQLAGCPKLEELQLTSTGVTDEGLADVAKLKQLKKLVLPQYGSGGEGEFSRNPHPERLSDKGLAYVGTMTNLESVYLSGSGITDAGLAHLAGLTNLNYLGLYKLPNVKGPGLASLKSLTKVKELRLDGTGISDDAMKYFKDLKQVNELVLPDGATPAVLAQIKDCTWLEMLDVPSEWPDDAVEKAKKMFPKAYVSKN